MHIKDLTITAGIAMFTLVGTLAIIGPTGVDARRGKRRALRANGVEMSLRTTRTTRRPTARLTLVNTTDRPVQVNPRIALFTEAPGSEFARMVQPPHERWVDEPLYVLEPGETKTVDIDPDKKVPRQSLAWFTLHNGKRQVDTNTFVARTPRARRLPKRRAGKLSKARRTAKRPTNSARQSQLVMSF